ncbi:MAG: hypothetical protein WCL32_16220 [Planctomycetota bacterium]
MNQHPSWGANHEWRSANGTDAKQIKVTTSTSGASCGFGFKKDERYLVYANGGKNGELWSVSLCNRTSDAKSDRAAGDFDALGDGTAPKANR